MVVRSAGYNFIAFLYQSLGHDGSIEFHLLLIVGELGLQSFVESHGFCGDDMFERTALNTGEYGRVE